MSKTIKIIDLLNKIANGEELPKEIKCFNHTWKLVNRCYFCNGQEMLEDYLANAIIESLNDEVEIIEDEDINIQDIEEIKKDGTFVYNKISHQSIIDIQDKINDLIKAVKKLDKEMNKNENI